MSMGIARVFFDVSGALGALAFAGTIGIKAANDYCDIAPSIYPFDPSYYNAPFPPFRETLCYVAETLEPYNYLYTLEPPELLK